ncbi:MAG: hypothetical protein IJR49_02750 [Treponema sp.]|nr:hypothetical protein [Treponema sp.]
MTFLVLFLAFFICTPHSLCAKEINPLYELPKAKNILAEGEVFIAGSEKGLFKISSDTIAIPLWAEGKVEQILRIPLQHNNLQRDNLQTKENKQNSTENTNQNILQNSEQNSEVWYFRTSKGILYSSDLQNFELRNNGITFLTVKKYDGKTSSLVQQAPILKDLSFDPLNPNNLVTATETEVYLSRDGGKRWKSIGSMSRATPGMKAVTVATIENQTVVFMAHPIFGLSYFVADAAKPAWRDVAAGIKMMPTLSSPDEIADIFPMLKISEDGSRYIEIYFTQSYLPNIYRFDWAEKKSICIYSEDIPCDTFDGITNIENTLLFTRVESLGSLNIENMQSPGVPSNLDEWKKNLSCIPGMVNTAWIPKSMSGFSSGVLLNELWLLYPGTINTPYADIANNKKGLYMPANRGREQSGIDRFRKLIRDNKLNCLVIDMKDDYGLLRYDTRDPLVKQKGRISQYAVTLDHFISEFKKDDVYLIARIVVFKDRHLSRYENGKYAVWDSSSKSPWIGIKGKESVTGEDGKTTEQTTYYDENWVDPYSPEVWEYNIAVAKELITRGFDEIQFDYIRFPTDGRNLHNATYRWRSQGMTKESALISFLSYARENIDAPIGIDIYGANGWYRSGTRTGQDAEMLCEYVDVISSMFYPSHFENAFMNYDPVADRTYRIYYYGSYRTTMMTRNRVISRPWVQAFKLNVSYDRQYYGYQYVQKQIFGVRDAADRGYLYWNNVGNYEYIGPDVDANTKFTGKAKEADEQNRKPAIGKDEKPVSSEKSLSVLDSVLEQDKDRRSGASYSPTLFVPFLRTKN